jgi:hypothetical protein
MLKAKLVVLASICTLFISQSWAAPSRVIVLRHGEKANAYALCKLGQDRSLALKAQYLGKGAENSLFDKNPPDAFFATTLHTLELIAPTADSWGLPVVTYSVVPIAGQSKTTDMEWITRQTRRAATEVLSNPKWDGKTVVMVWEHKHIANAKLVKQNPDLMVDLRQLLKLDQLPDQYRALVPKTWSGANFNFFWIIDYDASGNPARFANVRQNFSGKFSQVPNNDWGSAGALPAHSGCKHSN